MQQPSRMHSQGRGSAITTAASAVLIMLPLLLYQVDVTGAATYTVGDTSGWSFSFREGNWTRVKNFKAGDMLVFNYNASLHNVVVCRFQWLQQMHCLCKLQNLQDGK